MYIFLSNNVLAFSAYIISIVSIFVLYKSFAVTTNQIAVYTKVNYYLFKTLFMSLIAFRFNFSFNIDILPHMYVNVNRDICM